jgi:hypothetical protein
MADRGNMLHVGPMGWQTEGICSMWGQWDGRQREYAPCGANGMADRGNMLHVGPKRNALCPPQVFCNLSQDKAASLEVAFQNGLRLTVDFFRES